jgi:hypothetical protein
MKLIEILDQLSHGELVQLNLGNGNDPIDPTNYARIGNALNLGLAALHQRFRLKLGRTTVDVTTDTLLYTLDSALNVVKIEKVLDEEDTPLPLNVTTDKESLTTPDAQSFLLAEAVETDATWTVMFRQGHDKLTATEWDDPDNTDIFIPYTHLTPLLYFLGARLLTPVGAVDGLNHSNEYMMKYEHACRELEGQGMQIEQNYESDKFYQRGWV